MNELLDDLRAIFDAGTRASGHSDFRAGDALIARTHSAVMEALAHQRAEVERERQRADGNQMSIAVATKQRDRARVQRNEAEAEAERLRGEIRSLIGSLVSTAAAEGAIAGRN